jgi:hypothetical protein
MQIRDRILEFRRVKASELRPNPKNWRTHPPAQRDALRGVLAEIGFAGAILARELPDGSLELIDGHLRAETTPDQELPVLVLDLSESEADKLLAVHDPLAGMAQPDFDMLAGLVGYVETANDAVRAMLDSLLADQPAIEPPEPPAAKEVVIPEAFQILVECHNENEQQELYHRLVADNRKCRLLTM